MEIVRTSAEMSLLTLDLVKSGKAIGLVPTMGYLHQGHLSLFDTIRDSCDMLTASIFVNPIQFGEGEDIERYPRNEKRDFKMLEAAGCNLVFAPDVDKIYPEGFQTFVDVKELSKPACGRNRKDHFRGVATVVLKLFNITHCQVASFGLKDYQQARIIHRMVQDLDLNIELKFGEIIRDHDGLALSSRNSYLTDDERRIAVKLPEILGFAWKLVYEGERDARVIIEKVKILLTTIKGIKVEYIEILDPETLSEIEKIETEARLLAAIHVGGTRLIDNVAIGMGIGSNPIGNERI